MLAILIFLLLKKYFFNIKFRKIYQTVVVINFFFNYASIILKQYCVKIFEIAIVIVFIKPQNLDEMNKA